MHNDKGQVTDWLEQIVKEPDEWQMFFSSSEVKMLAEDALELLKPLCEAMKPTGLRMWHDGYVGDCPSCGRVIQFAQKYCHNCTRLLDWGEVLALPCEDDEET